jgi:hypothetical protein
MSVGTCRTEVPLRRSIPNVRGSKTLRAVDLSLLWRPRAAGAEELGALPRQKVQDVYFLVPRRGRRCDLKRNQAEGVARPERRRISLDEEPNQVQRRPSTRHSNEQGDPALLILHLK